MHRQPFTVLFAAALFIVMFVVVLPFAAGTQEGAAEETTPRADDAAAAGAEATVRGVSGAEESTTPESTTPESTNISSANAGCANPRSVDTFTGTENRRTGPFEITGDSLRIRFQTDPVGQDPFLPTVEVDVLNENGQPIGEGFIVFDGEDGSENILAGPGTFRLEIRADEASYNVTVEDCVGNDGGGGGGGNNNGNNNDNN